MTVELADTLKFAELMLKFQEVIRKVRIPRRPDHEENDVEHSYQLAMMAWYISHVGDMELNLELVLKYSLIHDIAECYAGDVHVLDREGRIGKVDREAAALTQLEAEFPEFPELTQLAHQYETLADDESNFVYALDKLMPMITIYLEGGSTWHELGFSMEELLKNKAAKTFNAPVISSLNKELEQLIRSNPALFPRL